jgi:F-type H+-transporting ATPase subunit a
MEHFWNVTLFGQAVHMNTLLMTWVAMFIIIVAAVSLTRKLEVVPSKGQVMAESIFDLCRSITMATAGKRGDSFLYFIGSLFLFILTANLMGQLPLRLFEIPHGELTAATGDINTTTALGLMSLLMYFFVGIQKKGFRYFKHYVQPHWLFLPLNIVEDFTRPGSLLLRLYFNILVGEILSGIAMGMMPYVLPAAVIVLELFVAVVQAYIFSILSSVYVSLLSEDHH